MEYNYKDDTLLHSVGFNLQRLDSILKNGLVSKNKAKELGLMYSQNYSFSEHDGNYISLVRKGAINLFDKITAYKTHTVFGINLIFEDVPYKNHRDKLFIHRRDEVLAKDYIPKDKIKGIAIPSAYKNMRLYELTIIPPDVTSYKFIYNITMNYVNFLKEYDYFVKLKDLAIYINALYHIHKALYDIKGKNEFSLDEEELVIDHTETLRELNGFLAEETYNCFREILGDDVTLNDLVKYIAKNLNIYNIPYEMDLELPKKGR